LPPRRATGLNLWLLAAQPLRAEVGVDEPGDGGNKGIDRFGHVGDVQVRQIVVGLVVLRVEAEAGDRLGDPPRRASVMLSER
jgi:hypothetical protein